MKQTVQPHIPGLARKDKKPTAPRLSETALQAQTLQTLAVFGYAALETGKARKTVSCPKCAHKFFPTGWQGNTPGFPDLSIFRYVDGFPGIAIFVEMKGAGTEIRPEQQALADAGRSVIAHSHVETVRAVLAAEDAMSAYQTNPFQRERLVRWLEENEGQK